MEPIPYDNKTPSAEPPNTSAARTIGVLNIIFGSVLILCGLCSALNLGMQTTMGPMMAAQQQQMQQAFKAERQRAVDQLEARAKASTDPKEKTTLEAQKKALENQPLPEPPDMSKIFQNPQWRGYMLADVVTGLLLNLLMVVSGI